MFTPAVNVLMAHVLWITALCKTQSGDWPLFSPEFASANFHTRHPKKACQRVNKPIIKARSRILAYIIRVWTYKFLQYSCRRTKITVDKIHKIYERWNWPEQDKSKWKMICSKLILVKPQFWYAGCVDEHEVDSCSVVNASARQSVAQCKQIKPSYLTK